MIEKKFPYMIFSIVISILIACIGIGTCINYVNVSLHSVDIDNQNFSAGTIDDRLSSVMILKDAFLNFNGGFAYITGQRQLNGVFRMDNGHLTDTQLGVADGFTKTANKLADNVFDFKSYCEEKGVAYIFVLAPYKIKSSDSVLFGGLKDYHNDNADQLLMELDKRNISYLDSRDLLNNQAETWYDFFYRTDHHWNVDAAYLVYLWLENYIHDKTGETVKKCLLDKKEYDFVSYSESFLGSYGKRTGRVFSGFDDFSYMIPRSDVTIKNVVTGESGSFKDICINVDKTKTATSCYSLFGGISGVSEYENNSAQNDLRVLIGGDSFVLPIMPFIEVSYRNVKTQYSAPCFTKKMIDDWKPNVVIQVVNPGFLQLPYFTYK